MEEWLKLNLNQIIGYSLSLTSIIIAYIQFNEKKKLQKVYKSNSWILFQRINNLGGTIQNAFFQSNTLDTDKSLYEKLVRSDALSAELLKEGIRLILLIEDKVSNKTIDSWVNESRISESDAVLFRKYIPTNKKLIDKENA